MTAGHDDALVAGLCAVLTRVALERRVRGTCAECGCLLRPLEPCPVCRSEAWRRPRPVARRRPWGVVVPDVSHEERERHAAWLRNFARTA